MVKKVFNTCIGDDISEHLDFIYKSEYIFFLWNGLIYIKGQTWEECKLSGLKESDLI